MEAEPETDSLEPPFTEMQLKARLHLRPGHSCVYQPPALVPAPTPRESLMHHTRLTTWRRRRRRRENLFFFFLCFLGLNLQHREVPRLGVELEPHL